uniref:Microsomal glutathione S-transferase 1 n=1 Tax=Ciona savignyi TaxID=51511 RepID=H2Y960_CIOSA
MSVFTLENEAFAGLVFYGALCLAKTTAMSMVTAFHRITKQSVPTEEDARMSTKDPEKIKRMLQPNDDVERSRKAHLNDLENVVPFVLLGLLYISTNPPAATALTHFKVGLSARLLHSVAYIFKLRAPSRGVGFVLGFATTISMLYRTISAVY